MSNIVVRFPADDPRLHTHIGSRCEGTISVRDCQAGYALFGPYIALLAGRYEARIRFAEGKNVRGDVVLDVCIERGARQVAVSALSTPSAESGQQSMSLEFVLGEAATDCEVRLWCARGAECSVAALELTYFDQSAAAVEQDSTDVRSPNGEPSGSYPLIPNFQPNVLLDVGAVAGREDPVESSRAEWTVGTLVGQALDASGATSIRAMTWRGSGFSLGPPAGPYRRPTLFGEQQNAIMEIFLPPGEWSLLFVQHDWSGEACVHDASSVRLVDLYGEVDRTSVLRLSVSSAGVHRPIVIEATGCRNPMSHGTQVWFLGAEGSVGRFCPERGRPISETCRLIDGIHGTFLTLRTDIGVSDSLAEHGVWEPKSVKVFQTLVRPGEMVVDVGANIGHHSLVLSNLVGSSGRVLAFEPQMQMYNLLNANIIINNRQNILPFRVALGEMEGVLAMYPISYDDFQPFGSLGVVAPEDANMIGELV